MKIKQHSKIAAITMNSDKKSDYRRKETEIERNLRIKMRREEWHYQQEAERKHEEKKLRMIEQYERKRALQIKETALKNERRYAQRSKSSSPQPRKSHFIDFERSKDFKTSNYLKDTTIDKKELHKLKQLETKDQSTSEKIEWDIDNPDDVIFPRKKGKESCPTFEKINVAAQAEEIEEIRTVTCIQSVIPRKQLSTDMDNYRYSADERDRYYGSHRPIRHQDERRMTDNFEYRGRYRRTKSKEEKDRNERRNRSHSYHSDYSNHSSYSRRRSHNTRYNSATSIDKDKSSYRPRSKSSSPIDKYARKKKEDNYKCQSSSQRLSRSPSRSSFRYSSKNDSDQSSKRNDDVRSERLAESSLMNFPPYPAHNNYLFPAPWQIRGQALPMIWPIGPRFLPVVYPSFPPHMIRWRMPPRGFNNNNNNNNRGAHHPH